MARYVIRLDDACPTMNHDNWNRVESMLDMYGIKPIVGVIPNSKDPEFNWEYDDLFWETVHRWQDKGWIIAQHGCYHLYHYNKPNTGYFQKSHSTNTEFVGLSYEEQKQLISHGYDELREHGVYPCCFFAPAHTYDHYTVEAVSQNSEMRFISDGYALHAFRKHNMVFLPSICDRPTGFPAGDYTFVLHPNTMNSHSFDRLNKFLQHSASKCVPATQCLDRIRASQGLVGSVIENVIFYIRAVRNRLKGK